jgi:hypothetical protein
MKQFTDVDDMLLLAPKMKKNSVLQYIGTPKEVRAGIVLKSNEVIEVWLYTIREKMMQISQSEINKKPPKSFKANLWGEEKNYSLIFVNDELIKWGYLEDVWPQFDKNDGDIIAPVSFKYFSENDTTKNSGLFSIFKKK